VSKVLLITGAGRGIGAATAKLAGGRGYDVAVNYLRDATAAGEVVAAIHNAGGRALAIQGDMAREEDVSRTFAAIDSELGRITHLVYNAGTTGGYSRLEDADTAMMRSVLELNVLGALMCVKAAAERVAMLAGARPLRLLFPQHERPTVISPIRPRERSALHFETAKEFDPIIGARLSKHVTSLQAAARAFELDA